MSSGQVRVAVIGTGEIGRGWAALIAAAGWPVAIDLVLNGVIDVDDLDRAISLGPALGWAAAGPHLTYHLNSGDEGFAQFFQHLHQTFGPVWSDLASWGQLTPEQQHTMIGQIERAYQGKLDPIRESRDRRLAAILKGIEDVKSEK